MTDHSVSFRYSCFGDQDNPHDLSSALEELKSWDAILTGRVKQKAAHYAVVMISCFASCVTKSGVSPQGPSSADILRDLTELVHEGHLHERQDAPDGPFPAADSPGDS